MISEQEEKRYKRQHVTIGEYLNNGWELGKSFYMKEIVLDFRIQIVLGLLNRAQHTYTHTHRHTDTESVHAGVMGETSMGKKIHQVTLEEMVISNWGPGNLLHGRT